MSVTLVRTPSEDEWHRTDVLGCSRARTVPEDGDRREVESGDWPAERCPNCTW